jgi:septal ring factor EnvC (AmiA/AmiB activator)
VKIFRYLSITLLLTSLPLQAEDTPKQQSLQREIRQLSNTLDTQKTASDNLQAEVTRIEQKLGDISRQQYQTEKKIDETATRLQDANQKKQVLDTELNAQKSGLAQQLQALYSAGEQSHLRLLLRQDEPSDISRTIRYFEYMNDSRINRIQKIQKTMKSLETVRASIDKDRLAMQDLTSSLDKQKTELQNTLNERNNTLQKVDSDIHSKEKQLDKLKQEEGELQTVVDRLAARQTADTPDATQLAADKTAITPKVSSKAEDTTSDNSTNQTLKAKTVKPATSTPATPRFVPDKPFSTLKGKLTWPVAGNVIHPYNSPRNEKQRWRGVVISANGGSKVRSVARGKVAFSGWMNGYGHLIIIEHDKNYMSLYGYNRAVYKQEGDIVNANETIAAVGNSSGQNQDGLYFEIRQGTSPQNPASWCR